MNTLDKDALIKDIVTFLKKELVDKNIISEIESTLNNASVRPIRVVWECCTYGEVSTEALTQKYGYNQPPRAARDVRELGFKLKTSASKTTDGRRMAVYSLTNIDQFGANEGRAVFTKKEKTNLVGKDDSKCFYCTMHFEPNELQIDHLVPFEVAGNSLHKKEGINALVLVCASCNRSKSWSCESCLNFKTKDIGECKRCYWFNPDNYSHVRMNDIVNINLTIDGNEKLYDQFKGLTRDEIKELIRKKFN
jgi:5-methylcytosine-specific restriction endonuclease McrA